MLAIDLRELRDTLERRRRQLFVGGAVLLGAALLGAVLYWWIAMRWKPPPSIFDTPVDDALGYLALPDFNKLPMEERMKFLLELADRFRNLEPSESAAAAAFLAAIVGPAREQLHENARVLVKDILVQGAAGYMEVPESERGAYIDRWLAEWMRTGERLVDGEEQKRTDDDRLEEARKDMRRNRERIAERGGAPSASDRSASRFMDFWQTEVEQASSPKEQGQIVHFMNDIRKHLTR